MKLDGKITILFDRDGLCIEITDALSSIRFVEARLDTDQTCDALSRLSCTPCAIGVYGLDKVGKKHEHQRLEFEMPKCDFRDKVEVAVQEAAKNCPEGWEPDNYFNSQDSFFKRDGKQMACCTIRRWVDIQGT